MDDDNSDIETYFDDPMADEAWLEYRIRREDDEGRLQQLRFGGSKAYTIFVLSSLLCKIALTSLRFARFWRSLSSLYVSSAAKTQILNCLC